MESGLEWPIKQSRREYSRRPCAQTRAHRYGEEKDLVVAHSLGGLVVEKALNLSRGAVEKALRQVEQEAAGVVFLGVPHCGADLAAWACMGTRMVKLIRHANKAIVEVLRPSSEVLREVEIGFRSILSRRG